MAELSMEQRAQAVLQQSLSDVTRTIKAIAACPWMVLSLAREDHMPAKSFEVILSLRDLLQRIQDELYQWYDQHKDDCGEMGMSPGYDDIKDIREQVEAIGRLIEQLKPHVAMAVKGSDDGSSKQHGETPA